MSDPFRPLPPIEGLDPGVNRLVNLLRSVGFETTDSGDGVTKFVPGSGWDRDELIEAPHVFIQVMRGEVIRESERLVRVLALHGVEVKAINTDGDPFIQASYDPVNGVGILELYNVTDEDLAS